MFKVIFLVKRRPDLSVEAYQSYSTDTHAPLVAVLPGLRRYVVNYAVTADGGDAPAHDGVIELWFDTPGDFEAALGSEAGQRALADQANFLDTSASVMLPVQEHAIV